MNRRGHFSLQFTWWQSVILFVVFWPFWLINDFQIAWYVTIGWWVVALVLAVYAFIRAVSKLDKKKD